MRRPASVLLLTALAALAVPAPASADVLTPAGGVPTATITRTSYGIPHITARDFTSLGFGHGYAVAEDTICTLADTLVTGRGERSRFFGPDARYTDQVTLDATNLQTDTVFRNLRDRKVVEALLADPLRGPGKEVRALVGGYVQGINGYLDAVGGARGITDPACRGGAWVRKAEPLDLYYGIYAANLLASAGVFVPQIADASPPTVEDPGLPVGVVTSFAPVPAVLPGRDALLKGLGKDPASPFGSNGTALGGDATTTGRGMVLGNPHFPWRGRYRFTQAQLTIPGVYDVAGAMLNGAPVVNIGWNSQVAWTHTVSTAYRFTPYEYRTLPGLPTTYLTTSGPRELQRDEVRIAVKKADGSVGEVVEDLYRTDQGFVVDSPDVLLGWTPASFFAIRDANAEHLKTLDAFFEMGRSGSVRELAAAQDRTAGIPWVNTMAADRKGDALYADNSVVPNVPDDLVQSCATPIGLVLVQLAGLPALDGARADGECAWRDDADAARPGIFGPANLPDTVRRDWVVNANDSYWLPNPAQPLEGFARIIGCERCERTLRTRMVYRYVMDRLARGRFTIEQLKAVEHENRVFAAELARQDDDLQDVCAAAGGGRACEVLRGWTGKDDVDAVGAHVFREFWLRTPAERFTVPFDAADPVGTPRDLDEGADAVVQAMRDAIAFLAEERIPLDAPLGSLQVAGDEGAPRIAVGGGPAGTGNANVLSTGAGASNLDALYPVAYGSSHIQAVAFTDEGVDASTILTYGLSTDPTRAASSDQTRLFGQERWVDFPFTAAEIRADAQRTYVVSAGRTSPAAGRVAAAPAAAVPAPARGALPATGGATLPVTVAGLAVLGAVLLRRRLRTS
ncbi:MAG: peptidase penicillin amidase [Frankiales bacterium]|nr:peptidase penicillin amidase [Frankiales bacterium]